MERFRALLRFFAFRWALAVAASTLLVQLLFTLGGAAPSGLDGLSDHGRRAAMNSVRLVYHAYGTAWLLAAAWPLLHTGRRRTRVILLSVAVLMSVPSLLAFFRALLALGGSCSRLAGPELLSVLEIGVWRGLVPLAMGLLPLAWLIATEKLSSCMGVRSWFLTGRGAHANWMSPTTLRSFTRDLPEDKS